MIGHFNQTHNSTALTLLNLNLSSLQGSLRLLLRFILFSSLSLSGIPLSSRGCRSFHPPPFVPRGSPRWWQCLYFLQSSGEGCFAHANCWQAEQKNRGAVREGEQGMTARQQEWFLKSKCLQRHNRSQAGRGEGHSSPLLRQAGLCANPSESHRSRRNLSRLPDFSIWLGSRAVDVEKLSVL